MTPFDEHSGPAVHDVDQVHGQPYPAWERFRRTCPVGRAEVGSYYDRPCYHVTTWEETDAALRDWQTFSASINAERVGRFMGELILAMDGAEHRSYRRLVAPAFRASRLERWTDTLIRPSIVRLLEAVRPAGRAELVADVTSRYPMEVICGILGVPLHDLEEFMGWAEGITSGSADPEVGLASAAAMRAYLRPIIESRRSRPTGDLISDLVHAEIDGRKLTAEKIFGFLLLLLPAGAETTFRAMGNALSALLTVPGLLDRVEADRDLIPAAIEETLRWETSVTQVSRVTTRDTVLGGCPIPAGAPIAIFTGSANHDERRFVNPEAFDIDRPLRPNLGFGTGEHQCLGMHLARLELRVGLDEILDRLARLRLDPAFPAPRVSGFAFRGPQHLHVLFDGS